MIKNKYLREIQMRKFELIATAAFGIEGIVADEVKELGFENVKTENGRVTYEADEEGLCKSNLWLRSADRVFLKIAQFRATSFEELFENTKKIPWSRYIPEDGEFPVNAKSVKSKLFSLSDIQSICKKAVVNKLSQSYDVQWFSEDGDKYSILVSILKDEVTIMLDTSGVGLHKRGYRENGADAPIRETLAAALLRISRWKKNIPLIDPLCGTGTIAIEAAMIARNIAPGLDRKFDCENWKFITPGLWKRVRMEAYQAIDYDTEIQIEAYDLNPRAIRIARENAEKAGVDDCIHFQARDVKDLSSSRKYGYVVTNPPYGERLMEEEDLQKLYEVMGERFNMLDTWSKYIITSYENFERYFGSKATKNRKLYNGKLKCYFYQYWGPKPPRKKKVEVE